MPVQIVEMAADDAFKTGATALFEEKYGDRVRVIDMAGFSKELCGGTHTDRTGNIGLFKLIGESSVASGVRRIEALTGGAALDYTRKMEKAVFDIANMVRETPEAVAERVKKLLADQRTLEKEIERIKAAAASEAVTDIEDAAQTVNGIRVVVKRVAVDTPAGLRDLADRFREKIQSGVVVLGRRCRRQGHADCRGHQEPDRPVSCRPDHQAGGSGGRRRRRRPTGHGPGRRLASGKPGPGPGKGAGGGPGGLTGLSFLQYIDHRVHPGLAARRHLAGQKARGIQGS